MAYDYLKRLDKSYLGKGKTKKAAKGNYTGKKLEHLKRLCELKCLFCDTNPGGIAHHLRAGMNVGMGQKNDDQWTIPVCSDCHDEAHTGEKKFYAKHGYDLEEIQNVAKTLWEESNDAQ